MEDSAVLMFQPSLTVEPYTLYITNGIIWSMGAFSYSQSALPPETEMGRYCSVTNAVSVFNSEHPLGWVSTSPFTYLSESIPICSQDDKSEEPLYIGNDVWIGQHVQLKRGIRIVDGAVVAAGSVVIKDVPPYIIVGGVPAKIIRPRFDDAIIRRMQEIGWWSDHFTDFHGLDPSRPALFLGGVEKRIAANALKPFFPDPLKIDTIRDTLQRMARQD